jgi:8-oxo-dGTP pyrophosphatase MutT (NUDIX family)
MPLAKFVAFHDAPEVGAKGLPALRFAVMIARARDGVVLVLSCHRKVWELPGGLIDPGETPRQAAERELVEEAGCQARGTAWLGVVEVNDGAAHFGAVYQCEVADVPVQFENAETAGLARWRRDHAPQPMGHTDAGLLERFG